MTRTGLLFSAAAVAEIAGCYSFWVVFRRDQSALWLVPGMLCMALFAWLLTFSDTPAAGRAYAAYGTVFVCISMLWLWEIEGIRPDRWDLTGCAFCIIGTWLILFAPRA